MRRELHALRRELGPELAADERVGRQRPFHVHEVELAVLEREPARLVLLDDADLDAADAGHGLALHVRDQLFVGSVARLEVPGEAAVDRVGLEQDLRAAHPLRQHVRTSADGVGQRASVALAVRGDHLARHRRRRLVGQHVRQVVVGFLQPEAQRVPVDRLHPGELAVVVELAALLRRGDLLVEADELALDQERPRRADSRVGEPLQRIDDVVGDKLARLALEHRVRREPDALPEPDRPGAAVVGDLRQRLGGQRHDLRGLREVVVGVQRLEDRLDDRAGVEVVHRGGVEAGLGDGEYVADHLVRVGGGPRRSWERRAEGGEERRRGERDQRGAAGARRRRFRTPGRRRPRHDFGPRSMYSHSACRIGCFL